MTFTVGSYLATRLSQIGLKHHFAVAGDFNLVLLDQLLTNKDLEQVYCCNELNCGYSAEGYARACGAAAAVVTFSVGGLSAINAEPRSESAAAPEAKLVRTEIVRQIQSLLTADTTVIAETGDSWFNGMALKLPGGARFEVEMQWGSIGWSVPATFGYAVGAPHRRIIAMIGDGSFQLTAQEVAQMIRRRLPVIIFLINNHGYTIEVEIHDGPYNNIKNWDYAGLIQAFNAEDGRGRGIRATNGGELADAIKVAVANHDGPTLIECVIDRDDCSSDLISWGRMVAAANARPPRPQ